ncbi:hypothetical protein DCAR_0727824 [Daucus carota subsp. sativus]|uniref:Uncharacterized protein n=1 Tax=Daucus carota subsp. sativus TaxID=79200 RepID=A0A164T2W1_DAUCS|nr:hypothetical protein DCAR_0727824 [Daucus carota subsp. sativus]
MATDESDSSAPHRKQRGRVTALDEFLLNRVSKLQHKGDHASPEPHSAHSDLPSTPRTTLGTVDTNICLNKINETNIDGKYVSSDVISDDFSRKYRGPSIQTILDRKSERFSSTSSILSGNEGLTIYLSM